MLSYLHIGILVCVGVAGSLSLPAPVRAQIARDVGECRDSDGKRFSVEARIDGCTRVIASGWYLGKNAAWAYHGRARAYKAKGDYDRAIVDYNEAIKLDPEYTLAYNDRGIAYKNKRDYDRAIADYNEVIRLEPRSAFAYNNLGNAYADKGDYERAMTNYNEAIRLDPAFAFAYNNRGLTYADKGDFDRAMADYDEAIRLDPNYADAYSNRGLAYKNMGDYSRAIADYSETIRLDPKRSAAYFSRGRLNLFVRTLAEAVADLNQASELNPTNAYSALWLDIANRRSNLPSRLPDAAKQVDMTKWPAPLIGLYLGELKPEAVLAAANDSNPQTKTEHVCEANFYIGELSLRNGDKAEATRLLRLAASTCPKRFMEYSGALAELKALGTTP